MDWTELDCDVLGQTGMAWTRLYRTGLGCAGPDWNGMDWTGLYRTGLDLAGLVRAGLAWAGLERVGLSCRIAAHRDRYTVFVAIYQHYR